MTPTPRSTQLLFWLGSALFALAVGVNTYVVMLAHGEVHDATKVASAVLLAAGATFVTGLPLGALLGMLPRGFGRPGVIVAWVAVGLAIGLLFVSEQTLLTALLDEDPVDFILTGWLWDHYGWAGSVLYLVTVPIDVVLFMVAAVMMGVAPFVLPPVVGLCSGFTWVLLALPFLLWAARRAA